jgi:hypothetical protein
LPQVVLLPKLVNGEFTDLIVVVQSQSHQLPTLHYWKWNILSLPVVAAEVWTWVVEEAAEVSYRDEPF